MKRLALVTVVTMLALPASALARASSGVVLSVDRSAHTAQVVGSGHLVHAYRVLGRLAGIHAGSQISFQLSSGAISAVRTRSSARRTVSFYGRVVRAGIHGLTLQLADGDLVTYASAQPSASAPAQSEPLAHAARATAPLDISALAPGVEVLATVATDLRASRVTIALPGPGAPEQKARGLVSAVTTDSFALEMSNQGMLRLHASPTMLARLRACERATVSYHQDAGLLVADGIHRTGSARGRCVSRSATGTISSVSASGLTITTRGGRSVSFTAAATTTGGFAVGDVVDVIYGRGRNAIAVQYAERRTTGTVTAAASGEMTIINGATGHTETFATTATVAIGDRVVVVYHQSVAGLVADSVYALA